MFASCHYLSPGNNSCLINPITCEGNIPRVHVSQYLPTWAKKNNKGMINLEGSICMDSEKKFDATRENNDYFKLRPVLINECS